MVLNITLQIICQRNTWSSCGPPMGYTFPESYCICRNTHISSRASQRNSQGKLPSRGQKGIWDGLLTKHWRGLALITRSKPKQKQEGRRNVTTLGNMHWQLMLLLRLDVSSTIVGSCPRTSTIGASALETAGCGRWNCCLKIKTGHYHPSSFLLLFFSRMTVTSRGIFDNVFLALAQKVALIFALGFQNGCLLLSVCSPYPCPKDMIADCELLESIISPLTAIKRKNQNQSQWILAYFFNWCEWDERDGWLLWPLQDNCVSCVAWMSVP